MEGRGEGLGIVKCERVELCGMRNGWMRDVLFVEPEFCSILLALIDVPRVFCCSEYALKKMFEQSNIQLYIIFLVLIQTRI